ncbi:hypothetical protein [Faecalicatena contorta]|uniref:Uncharacterized protein n=1 Tax=Faecalicatena contorta TaxID=39482 RepID=A0A315ZWU3_9FIRM|nr:hypothetical protein [Faecalicatena contorta]PWJ49338.1 hypothetical protein A8805_10734 [Faecalicatena contorta]SUQ14582.1 hypothetical protein SAMN05216529_10734 [Faecalicatena contorta]
MNEQEVINELHRMKKQLSGAQGCSIKTQEVNQYRALCLRRAIAALEKQIPYKPTTPIIGVGKCKCGVEFLDRKTNYCGNCGQRLDWGAE